MTKKLIPVLVVLGISVIGSGFYIESYINSEMENTIYDQLIIEDENDVDYLDWIANTDADDIPIFTKYYFLNLTNPSEILLGSPPKFTEIGPFTFREFEIKHNIGFSSDQVSFQKQTYYVFQPHLSAVDNLDVQITNVNPSYSGILASIGSEANLQIAFLGGTLDQLINELRSDFVSNYLLQSTPLIIGNVFNDLSNQSNPQMTLTHWINGATFPGGVDLTNDTIEDFSLNGLSSVSLATATQIFNQSNSLSLINSLGFFSWLSAPENPEVKDSIQTEFSLNDQDFEEILNWLLYFSQTVAPYLLIQQFSPLGVETVEDIGYLHWGNNLVTQGISIKDLDQSLQFYPEIWAFSNSILSTSVSFSLEEIKNLFDSGTGLQYSENIGLFLYHISSGNFDEINAIWKTNQNQSLILASYLTYLIDEAVNPVLQGVFQFGGGLIRSISVGEWLFHTNDPLMTLISPENSDTSLFSNQTSSTDPSIAPASTINTGRNDISQIGQVIKDEGQESFDFWLTPEKVGGTDGRNFSPNFDIGQDLKIWSPEIKRQLKLEFISQVEIHGIEMMRFELSPSDLESSLVVPENQKYFQSEKGLFNLTSIVKVPIYLSKPHFLDTSPTIYETYTGIFPSKEAHDTYLDVEPLTGATMSAAQRLQFNLKIFSTDIYYQDVSEGYYPILWIDKSAEIPEDLAQEFVENLNRVKFYQSLSRNLGIGLGGILLLVSFWTTFRTLRNRK